MGWTILYIAFGLVALWLLGEVLFQNKAPLRWRLLALCGFLGVVTGVLLPSVIVIALGGIAFAVGQTYVTLSVRRGYMDGWTIGGRPKPNRRRRARSSRGPAAGPNLQVSGLTEETPEAVAGSGTQPTAGAHDGAYVGAHDGVGAPDPYQPLPDPVGPGEPPVAAPDFASASAFADAPTVYAPQPLPDETGAYGVYSRDSRPDPLAAASYDVFGNVTAEGDANAHGYGGGYGAPPGQGEYTDPYPAYDDGSYHGGQAPYSDPYIGTQQYAAHYDPYEEPDAFGGTPYQAGQYDGLGGQPAQQYGQEYYHPQTPQTPQNPLDDAWVPQQRDTGHAAEHPSYPPPQPGYDEQRYHY
ncbi:hypothetical protein [Streptomyces sp. 769]|uniref:hypothetical protein n=1 Tax=Streptomyces sp. 769 TaxID=1262452 RepID=UPI00057DC4F6|nr:hypothetical protein [Streptomyces sp. 769]AJC58984.1 hypothetical protein GZL_06414 [Streptomyces sp. 769]